MKHRGWASASAAVALALALALVAAGCGGDEGGAEGVASLGDTTSESDDATGTSGEQRDFREAALEFAECMRKNGVDMPDPDESGMFEITPETQPDPNDPTFRRAQERCGKILENARPPELSEEDRQELEEQTLAFARCMRKQGIDVPDPGQSEGGGFSLELPEDFDPKDPKFQKAQEACREHLPFGERGGDEPGADD